METEKSIEWNKAREYFDRIIAEYIRRLDLVQPDMDKQGRAYLRRLKKLYNESKHPSLINSYLNMLKGYLSKVKLTEEDQAIKQDRLMKQMDRLFKFYSLKQARWEELKAKSPEKKRIREQWNEVNTRRAFLAAFDLAKGDYEKREIIYDRQQTTRRIQGFQNKFGAEYDGWSLLAIVKMKREAEQAEIGEEAYPDVPLTEEGTF